MDEDRVLDEPLFSGEPLSAEETYGFPKGYTPPSDLPPWHDGLRAKFEKLLDEEFTSSEDEEFTESEPGATAKRYRQELDKLFADDLMLPDVSFDLYNAARWIDCVSFVRGVSKGWNEDPSTCRATFFSCLTCGWTTKRDTSHLFIKLSEYRRGIYQIDLEDYGYKASDIIYAERVVCDTYYADYTCNLIQAYISRPMQSDRGQRRARYISQYAYDRYRCHSKQPGTHPVDRTPLMLRSR